MLYISCFYSNRESKPKKRSFPRAHFSKLGFPKEPPRKSPNSRFGTKHGQRETLYSWQAEAHAKNSKTNHQVFTSCRDRSTHMTRDRKADAITEKPNQCTNSLWRTDSAAKTKHNNAASRNNETPRKKGYGGELPAR